MALKVGELYASFGIDSSGLDSALSGIENKCNEIASSFTKTGAIMSAAVTAPLVKLGKEIYDAGTGFYAQMSRVEAISGATASEVDALTAAAIQMGSTTSFTSTQAGEALEYMAMAGWSSEEMLAGLAPIMNLAAASGEDLGEVSDIVTDALTAFGLSANDAAHFSDVLAATATSANTDVGMMGYTFEQVGALAGAMGYEIDDMAVAIGLMANAGIKGEKAGTQLRTLLANMADPTDEMSAAMQKLGISLTDASGNMLPFDSVLSMLRTSFSGLSEEEQIMYASTIAGKEGMAGLLALINASDEDVDALTASIEGCDGAAEDMANTILDNAAGDMTIFKSAVEGLEITLWGLAEGGFRQIIQKATEYVDAFRNLDSGTQTAILKMAALAAAAGPVLLAAGRIVKIVGKLIPLMSALASPIGIVAGALALFAVAAVDANNEIGKTFTKLSKKVKSSLETINSKITSSIATVSKRMPALCSSIVEGIQDIVPAFMDTALLAVTGFMDTIADNASNIADIGKTIITSILGGISKNLPKLVPAAAKMVTKLATSVINNIPTFVKAVGNLVSSAIQGVKDTDWASLGKEILATIGDSFKEIVTILKGWFEQAKTAIQNIDWGGVWETIKGAFNVASDWLKNLILGDAATDSSTWSDVGAKIWGWIKSGFTATGDWVKKIVLGESYTADAGWDIVGKAVWEKIKAGITAVGDWVKELVLGDSYTADAGWDIVGKAVWEKIKSGVSAVGDWVKKLVLGDSYTADAGWNIVGSAIWDKIKAGIAAVGDWIKGLVLGDTYTPDASWVTVGSTIWEKIKSGITATGDWIKSLVLGNAFTADSSWADVGEKIVSKISEGLSGLDSEKLSGFIGDLSSVAEEIAKKIVAGKVEFVAKAGEFISKFMSGFSGYTGWDSFTDTFKTLAGGIIDGIGNGITAVGNAGSKIIGIIAGILGGEGFTNFTTSIKKLAGSLITKIVEQLPKVTDAAKNIIGAISGFFNGEGYKNYLTGLSDLAGGIIDKLVEAIPDVGNAVNDIVGAIGGLLTGDGISTALGSLTNLASAIIDGIVAAIPDLLSSVTKIVTTIGDTLKTVQWSTIGDKLGNLATSIIDGIVSAIGALGSSDFSGLITAIGDGIISAVEGLATAASTIVGKLVGYLVDPANLLKIAQVGVQFVGELVKGILGLGASLIEGAAGVLSNTIVGFFRGLFGIEVDPYVEQMVNEFFDIQFDVPTELFDGYGKACGYALVDAMGSTMTDTKKLEEAVYSWGIAVQSGYSQFFPEYEWLGNESVVNMYKGFLSGMESNTSTVEESAKAAALLIGLGYGENLENSLAMQQPEVAAELEKLLYGGGYVDLQSLASEFGYDIGELMAIDLPDGYTMAIQDGMPKIISTNQQLLAAGDAAIAEGWNTDELLASLWNHTFSTSFSEIKEWQPQLTELLENMGVEAGSLLGVALPDGVAEGLKNGTISVEEAAAEIAAAAVMAQSDVNAAVEDNTAKGEETGGAVATGEENAQSNVETASGGLHDAVTGSFDPLPEELSTTTQEAMDGMETTILDGQSAAETAAYTVSDAVVKEFVLNMSEANGRQIGATWVNSVRNAIASAKGALQSEAANAANIAKSAASNVLSYSAGSSIGRQFDNGIAAGIRAGSSAISAAARAAAQAALTAAKHALGIHSPSTVAEKEIGYMYDEGVANGLLKRMGIIADASRQVSSELHDSFYVGDPSRGTVYTSGDAIQQTARQTAQASADEQSATERAKAIGTAMADRLIESGALAGDVIMDKEKVGEKVSAPVSKAIRRKTNTTVAGRSAQGVLA